MAVDCELRLDFAKGVSPKKLNASIGRSGLKLATVNGPTDDRVGFQVLENPKAGIIQRVREEHNEAFVAKLPRVMERMLLVDSGGKQLNDAAYTDLVGRESLQENFLPIAAALTRTDRPSQAVIRVVHGASTEVPYRGISYPVPALVLAEQLISEGVDTQLQMIYANHISGSLNDRDLAEVRAEGRLLARAQRSFAQRFFPEKVAEAMVFLEDRPLAEVPHIEAEMRRLAIVMAEVLPEGLKEQLKEKDSKHGGNGKQMDYAGAHLLVHNAPSGDLFRPMFEDQALAYDPQIIFNYGGGSEGDYYHARTIAVPLAGEDYQTRNLQFFSRHRFPGYFTNGGDISLRAVLETGEVPIFDRKNANFSRGAGADINYLIKVAEARGNGLDDLKDYLSSFRKEVYA